MNCIDVLNDLNDAYLKQHSAERAGGGGGEEKGGSSKALKRTITTPSDFS